MQKLLIMQYFRLSYGVQINIVNMTEDKEAKQRFLYFKSNTSVIIDLCNNSYLEMELDVDYQNKVHDRLVSGSFTRSHTSGSLIIC